MTIFLLQARGDPAADRVADGLAHFSPIRLALGRLPAPVALTNVDVVVAWSAAAQALGWARFAALLGQSCVVTLVQVDGSALPETGSLNCAAVPWRDGEPIRIKLIHHDEGAGSAEAQRGDAQNSAARIAAGVVAALGVMASGAAQPVPANPVMISRRESTEKREAGAEQTAQAEIAVRAATAETVARSAVQGAIVDLDALVSAAMPTHASAAKGLVDAMMKPAPVRLAVPDVAKRRIQSIVPGLHIRQT